MSARARRRPPALVLAALLAVGCAANPAPNGWLPRAEELPRGDRGAWITLDPMDGPRASGELIAVSEDQVLVLTGAGLRQIPSRRIGRATLALYDAEAGKAARGALWSLTHPFITFLIPLTPTMWFVYAAAVSRAPLLRLPPATLESFRPYARFPQGPPPALVGSDLGDVGRPEQP